MLVLVTYDVSTEDDAGKRRLHQVAKQCEKYGQRVQNSVFECLLQPDELMLLKHQLIKIMDENKELYDEIKSSHLLISEYPNKSMPTPEQFPWRNRIIAGLSNTIVVAEAGIHSRTYITVADGLMNGRNICCVPHMANLNSGCNKLIKEGAALVENAKDVIDEMTIYKK